jgi:hypothetical protein
MTLRRFTLAAPVILMMAALACSLSSGKNGTSPAEATLNALYTAGALTAQSTSRAPASVTPAGSATNPFPTVATAMARPSAAHTTPCNAAAFVRDVSIADGMVMDAAQDFTKTWRLQNTGACSWNSTYALVFIGGDRMNAAAAVYLSGTVNPGQSIDLSLDMKAPTQDGSYQGFWKLRDAAGVLFGIGPQAQDAFWVKIRVAGPSFTAYDFAANSCSAQWRNNNTDLPCPGPEGDAHGYVMKLDHPVMENGQAQDLPGLLTVPRNTYNGMIFGTFPALKIQDGDAFRARVNCQYKAYDCNVNFRLSYQIGNGAAQTLGSWNEAYEGKYYLVDVDLSALAGKNVSFILTVGSNGAPDQDQALWIAPRIVRRGAPTPTASATYTPSPTLTPTYTPTSTPTPTQTATSTPTATATP